jgi:hypothetical protein
MIAPKRRWLTPARLSWCIAYWLAGFAFWLPSMAVHAVRGESFGSNPLDIPAVTVFPVAGSWPALELLELLTLQREVASRRGAIAILMLLGIWMLGPAYMIVSNGFAGPFMWMFLFAGLPFTFVISTYDGTLGALAIVTVWFILIAALELTRTLEQRPAHHDPERRWYW